MINLQGSQTDLQLQTDHTIGICLHFIVGISTNLGALIWVILIGSFINQRGKQCISSKWFFWLPTFGWGDLPGGRKLLFSSFSLPTQGPGIKMPIDYSNCKLLNNAISCSEGLSSII